MQKVKRANAKAVIKLKLSAEAVINPKKEILLMAEFSLLLISNPDFTTIGVGTGGGEHATLARRDIERCISCHDVQGADPTCITCHLDSDGIKGTNPKTHPAGFMKGENRRLAQ